MAFKKCILMVESFCDMWDHISAMISISASLFKHYSWRRETGVFRMVLLPYRPSWTATAGARPWFTRHIARR